MSVIKVSGVSKTYRKVMLFSGVTFSIEPGTITALVGPNGSGKSVLLRILCGFTSPDEGSVEINPDYFDSDALFPAEFGVVIDRPGYISQETGLQNLLRLAEIRKKIGEDDVVRWMGRLGLNPDDRTRVGNYSLGMKQKLSIAQAVMEEQRMLVLDEPFNALDESSSDAVRQIIREHRKSGGTILFTSHSKHDVVELADRTLIIDDKKVSEAQANS